MDIFGLLKIIKDEKLDKYTDFEICLGCPRAGGKRVAGTGDRGAGVYGIFEDIGGIWRKFHMNERGGVRIANDGVLPLSYTETEAFEVLLELLRIKKEASLLSKKHFFRRRRK